MSAVRRLTLAVAAIAAVGISAPAVAASPTTHNRIPHVQQSMRRAAPATGGTGSISGTVTDSSTHPIKDVCVTAFTSDGAGFGEGLTSATGTYTIGSLPAGSYEVQFSPEGVTNVDLCGEGSAGCGSTGLNYVGQYYNGALREQDATLVPVTTTAVTGIDATLQTGAIISGTVKSTSAVALSSFCVTAESTDDLGIGGATTNAKGAYKIIGLPPGTYSVNAACGLDGMDCGPGSNYVSEYYKGVVAAPAASPVVVAAGATVPKINFALPPGASIAGQITSGTTNLQDICVNIETATGAGTAGNTLTDANGNYVVYGLAAASYTVYISDCLGTGGYASTSIANVIAGPGATVTGENASLTTTSTGTGTISGKVTNAANAAVSGICVTAISTSPANASFPPSSVTAAAGTYKITDVPARSYDVEFTQGCGNTGSYGNQFYNGAVDEGSATAVTVTAGATKSGVNAKLAAAATITGTVTGTGGAPVGGVCVQATIPGGGIDPTGVGFAQTAADGTYSITGLAATSYDVEFSADCYSGGGAYAPQYYSGATRQAAATAVVTTAGNTSAGVNASLVAASSITGKVTTGGAALAGICVVVMPTDGDYTEFAYTQSIANGTYKVSGLAAGAYTVEFADGCGSGLYNTQYWKNSPTAGGATPVTVAAAKNKGSINAAMVAS